MAYVKMLNFCHTISFGIEFAVLLAFLYNYFSFKIYDNYKF
jgi:hypothetical protein